MILGTAVIAWLIERSTGANAFAYDQPILDGLHAALSCLLLAAAVVVVGSAPASRSFWNVSVPVAAGAVLLGFAALAACALVPGNVSLFNHLAAEDGPLENATTLLLFSSSAVFLVAARTLPSGEPRGLVGGICVLLAGAFFVLAMEEISWMQRIIGYRTPPGLAETNWQGETNLHNTQTFLFGCVYYLGSALALVLLPLLRPQFAMWRGFGPLQVFLPGAGVALVAAPAFMFNFGHWNVLFIQLAFWITALAMWKLASVQRRALTRAACLLLLVAMLAGQGLVLTGVRAWPTMPDSTEYQELLIALGYFCFSVGAYRRLRSRERRSA